jgi:hypothetical protein
MFLTREDAEHSTCVVFAYKVTLHASGPLKLDAVTAAQWAPDDPVRMLLFLNKYGYYQLLKPVQITQTLHLVRAVEIFEANGITVMLEPVWLALPAECVRGRATAAGYEVTTMGPLGTTIEHVPVFNMGPMWDEIAARPTSDPTITYITPKVYVNPMPTP